MRTRTERAPARRTSSRTRLLEAIEEKWTASLAMRRVLDLVEMDPQDLVADERGVELERRLAKLGIDPWFVDSVDEPLTLRTKVRLRLLPKPGVEPPPWEVETRAAPARRASAVQTTPLPEGQLRALSIRQPWVELILRNEKDVENRTKLTHHRGPLLIHASLTVDRDEMAERGFDKLPQGALVGVVDVVDCTEKVKSDWHTEGYWGWYLENPRRFARPIPFKGAVGIMRVPAELVREALASAEGPPPGGAGLGRRSRRR